MPIPGHAERIRVRCNHCENCKAHRAQEWCLRLELESKYWPEAVFVTLTYDDLHLPLHAIDGHLFFSDEEIKENPELEVFYEPTLRAEHLSAFVKRLRKRTSLKIRYYGVGEYGTRRGRPHLHLIIFGLPYITDCVKDIEESWPFGFVQVKPFFRETCGYVAGYIQKKLYGDKKYTFALPEFMRCSQHIGEQWLWDNRYMFSDDHPFINMHGYKYGLPRQFRKKLVEWHILSESSLIQCALLQIGEYKALMEDLENKHTKMSEFFDQRIKNAQAKALRKLSKRNKTGDI